MTQHLSRAAWDARCRRIESQPLASNLGTQVDLAAEAFGERPAIVMLGSGERLSYEGLRRLANRFANALAARGVGKGTRVALMSWNSPAVPALWFALAKLGAVLAWANARYTPRELAYVVDDAWAEHVVLHPALVDTWEGIAEKPVRVPAGNVMALGPGTPYPDLLALAEHASEDFTPHWPVGPDDLVNLQYTSGTSGFPKGCMLTHRFWLVAGQGEHQLLGFRLARALYNQNLFYVDGPIFLALGLFAGNALYVADRPSAQRFVPWVKEHGLEYCYFFEALYRQPATPADTGCGLKLAHTFGFSPPEHAELERRYGMLARESYGMTECGPATHMPIEAADMVGSASCGWPAPYRQTSVRNEAFDELPAGETGELWLKGPGLMLGYHNRPEDNARTFRDGWMRTGDLFRRDERGYLYIVGRLKEMIRRNAENIAVREVETVLRAMPGVAEAAVMPVPDSTVGEEVKAYVQLEAGFTREQVSPETILAHCRRDLAPFKVPRYIAYCDAFPKTDSDRVEKKKLIAGVTDLREGSFDRVDGVWR
jgi:acyl-CoA synthetase (AMP-forming)/AMP-acid ligase II